VCRNCWWEEEGSRIGNKEDFGIHEERKMVGYARISSHTQKDDLERQIKLIKSCAKEEDWM